MQNVGLVYVSIVKPSDLGLFASLSELNNKQIELLGSETSLTVDGTSIQILGNNRSEEGDGDFIGCSFFALLNIDPASIHVDSIENIFNDIVGVGADNVSLKEPSPDQIIIGVRPGTILNEEDKQTIVGIISKTTQSFDIRETIDALMVSVKTDSVMPPVLSRYKNPTTIKGSVSPDGPQYIPETHTSITPESIEEIAELVFRKVIEKLNNEGDELSSALSEIKQKKAVLEKEITNSVIQTFNKHLEENSIKSTSAEPSIPVGGIAGVESALVGIISTEPETTIYDKQIKLTDLIGGCESEEDLFNKVLENKDKLTRNELINVSEFDMYLSLTANETKKFTNREQMMRKIKLSIM